MTTPVARQPSLGTPTTQPVALAWSLTADEVAHDMAVTPAAGLSSAGAQRRLAQYGPNQLQRIATRGVLAVLVGQFKSLVVLLLFASAAVSAAFGEWIDAGAILAVIIINAAIGFFTELRAVRSMEALRQLADVTARVRRDGVVSQVSAEQLVPGDVVLVEGGDVVSADIRLTAASKLQVAESPLTGESLPVSKQTGPVSADDLLGDRTNMLFKGTSVTRGTGEGVVVATGMQTELGQISSLVASAEGTTTPLEHRLEQLGRRLLWVTLGTIVVVGAAGILRGKDALLMFQTSVALAVAAIPEGLPIVATIALARGVLRMARNNAIVNRLEAVETLGGTSVICTDKTGTLTENKMTVTRVALPAADVEVTGIGLETRGGFISSGGQPLSAADPALRLLLETGALCNNATLTSPGGGPIGDPVEVALLIVAAKAGLARADLLTRWSQAREEPFDSSTNMMATFHHLDTRFRVAVKGAPESVLAACTHVWVPEGPRILDESARAAWNERNERLAEQGLRLLALATRSTDDLSADPYRGLALIGLAGMLDPPRPGVRQAITLCRRAGIRVIMVTGDHPATARTIGLAVGLVDEGDTSAIHGSDLRDPAMLTEEEREHLRLQSVFARVSPRQKLDLIALHQETGAVVAMTGDGLNDAPALKKADIGIAMGMRGTQVAREAADMVLKDDSFCTIVLAVEQGRIIFNNTPKFVRYLISCNVSEVAIVFLASLANAPLPILPLQILFLNLVTDLFPALALGVGKGDAGIMSRPPRNPRQPIVSGRHWLAIVGYGLLITVSVLGAFAVAIVWLGDTQEQAVTISFLTLAFAQFWLVFNMREPGSRFLRNEVTRNPYVWGALALCSVLLLLAVYVPGLSAVLGVVTPRPADWLLVLGASLAPWGVGQVIISLIRAPATSPTSDDWSVPCELK